MLITNRNVDVTGNCPTNSICTTVNCLLHSTVSIISVTIEVTFLPCNDPISARTQIVIADGIYSVVIDEISMGNHIPLPSPF